MSTPPADHKIVLGALHNNVKSFFASQHFPRCGRFYALRQACVNRCVTPVA
jgi:hypothetical protein